MTDTDTFDNYTIPTLREKRPDGIRGIAYCPICDRAEESRDYGNGEQQAIVIAIGKVRLHMHLTHRVKNGAADSPRPATDSR